MEHIIKPQIGGDVHKQASFKNDEEQQATTTINFILFKYKYISFSCNIFDGMNLFTAYCNSLNMYNVYWKLLITFLAVTCNNTAVDNSIVDPAKDTVVVNATVTYTCNDGFTHTCGDLVRTCTGSGQMTGRPPICASKLSLGMRRYGDISMQNRYVEPRYVSWPSALYRDTTLTYVIRGGHCVVTWFSLCLHI